MRLLQKLLSKIKQLETVKSEYLSVRCCQYGGRESFAARNFSMQTLAS